MVVEPLAPRAHPVGVALPTRVVHRDGAEHEWTVAVPEAWAPGGERDASGALGPALMLAMYDGDDEVEVRGRVDAALLERSAQFSELVEGLLPGLRPPRVRVEGAVEHTAGGEGRGIGGFLSRGVDSIYLAARRESFEGAIEHLVFIDGFEPLHSASVREAEIEGAREVAGRTGLPLTVVEADIRPALDGRVDLADVIDPVLAWAGHGLRGALRRIVIPSGLGARGMSPGGAFPLLAPLLSTPALAVEAGSVARDRLGKVAWLAEHRPDLLGQIKVCFAEDRPDNCGRCVKCVYTMMCLRACGALERATQFGELDMDRVRAIGIPYLSVRVNYSRIMRMAADRGDRELAAALRANLQRSVREAPLAPGALTRMGAAEHSTELSTAVLGGVADREAARGIHPEPAADDMRLGAPVPRGLLRTLDLRGRRHLYGAGTRPPGELTAELGALQPPGPGRIPLWISADGAVATPEWPGPAVRAGARRRLRWALAPIARSRVAAARRALDAALASAPERPAGRPTAHLLAEGGPGRLPLFAATHPIMGDVLLATDPAEFAAAGYPAPALLGHLAADAPETGRLGLHRRPVIPWSR